MPRRYRMTRREFATLQVARGKRVHGTYLSLLIAPLPGASGPKAAFVVSKKIARQAVDRNVIERRLRSAVVPYMKALQQEVALVFYAKRGALGATYEQIRSDVQELLERATMLRT